MHGTVTINDVAAAAGVSRQTVTRAMNGMYGISANTRERVLTAARELRYQPSRFGRGLVMGQRHRTLGLVIHDLTNPYYPELASAVIGFAARAGWNVVVADTMHANDRHTLLAELSQQVDAIAGYLWLDGNIPVHLRDRMPVVEIDPTWRRPLHGAVRFDMRPAMRQTVRHLLQGGVRQPVMLDYSPPGRPSGRARIFLDEMQRQGVEASLVYATGDGVEGGASGALEILDRLPGTDGVLAFNDLVAFGVLQSFRENGRSVPGQVKVVGIDGLAIGRLVTPALTTLSVDLTDVARLAVQLVLDMSSGSLPSSGRDVRRRVRHRLLLRSSA